MIQALSKITPAQWRHIAHDIAALAVAAYGVYKALHEAGVV